MRRLRKTLRNPWCWGCWRLHWNRFWFWFWWAQMKVWLSVLTYRFGTVLTSSTFREEIEEVCVQRNVQRLVMYQSATYPNVALSGNSHDIMWKLHNKFLLRVLPPFLLGFGDCASLQFLRDILHDPCITTSYTVLLANIWASMNKRTNLL